MSAHETIFEYYLHQHSNIEKYLELCVSHADPEVVHQLRLSIKKLQAFNKLADQLWPAETHEHLQINNRTRQLYQIAGQLRDTQVQIDLLTTFEAQTGITYREYGQWLLKREKKKIKLFSKKKYKVIPHPTSLNIYQRTGENLARTCDESIIKCAVKVLAGLSLKAQKLSEGKIDDRNLHRIRIISKRTRYILNIIQHSYPDFTTGELLSASLREIEAATGHWHDSLVKVELLGKCMIKLQSADNKTMLKYKKLLYAFNSELHHAYVEACIVVQREMHQQAKES